MLLSIDVGIKNLALCVIDKDKKIHFWEVDGIPPLHKDGLFKCMKGHLDSRKDSFNEVTQVIIEKQPNKNQGIKSIENFIHAYFLIHDKEVTIWDARHKIPDIAGPGKTKYTARKNASIERCRKFLNETNPDWVPLFDKHKKKDDLADTVMQALSYMNMKGDEPTHSVPKPRKPTLNQTNTKYSKSNLAYIVKNKLPQDARFIKDLHRYYKTVDELVKEFNITV
jgi:hypothetical protein